MEEEIIYDTIRVYDAVNNIYYDKQVPHIYDLEKGKADKLAELEVYITSQRASGIEWHDQVWSIDEECEKNLTSQITMLSFAPSEKVVWFSKSQANELAIADFKELALAISNAISQSKVAYYQYKNAIENAESEEELNSIVFGDVLNEVE